MMILSVITVIVSFLIQGIMSNCLGYHFQSLSIFLTVYPLIAILVLVPYFENHTKRYFFLFIVGLIIDVVYTHTFILNACLFIGIYFFSSFFHFYFPYNLLTINISNLLSIFIYHIFTFVFLFLMRYDNYSIMLLLKVLSHSIIMTIIYSSMVYLIVKFFFDRFHLHEIK